jgi:hypothetical protein
VSERHNYVLEVYVVLGCPIFEPDQIDEIKAWLAEPIYSADTVH